MHWWLYSLQSSHSPISSLPIQRAESFSVMTRLRDVDWDRKHRSIMRRLVRNLAGRVVHSAECQPIRARLPMSRQQLWTMWWMPITCGCQRMCGMFSHISSASTYSYVHSTSDGTWHRSVPWYGRSQVISSSSSPLDIYGRWWLLPICLLWLLAYFWHIRGSICKDS